MATAQTIGETTPSTLNRTLGRNMLGSEGPCRPRIRAVVEPPFRPRAVERHRQAVEETSRCYSPVGTSTRQTTQETTLAGVELDEGALVGAVLASANRDERRWTDPDRFDLHRKEGAHLAFATGAHYWLGACSAGQR